MALSPGTWLGAYEIISALGAGGMGEVYRARDTQLNRDVALKIVPEAFATDPDRLARFKREAQVLASLNHPPDSQRFLMLKPDVSSQQTAASPSLVVVLNWLEELKARVPTR
jgi:serine/threonine protein kinase